MAGDSRYTVNGYAVTTGIAAVPWKGNDPRRVAVLVSNAPMVAADCWYIDCDNGFRFFVPFGSAGKILLLFRELGPVASRPQGTTPSTGTTELHVLEVIDREARG